MSGFFPFAVLTNDVERRLVAALGLWPHAVDPTLARATGNWKGTVVTISTRAYSGPCIRYARFVTICGEQLEIGNLLCLADPRWPLPILGADLVAVGRETAMLAADLSPTLPIGPERAVQLAQLASKRASRPPLPPGGPLPSWCRAWFSDHALYTRVGLAQFDDAAGAVGDFPDAFVALAYSTKPAPQRRDATAAAQEGYLAAHRTDDKGLGLLATLFGSAWAARYVGELLFPQFEDANGA